jgi:hypothetical protein
MNRIQPCNPILQNYTFFNILREEVFELGSSGVLDIFDYEGKPFLQDEVIFHASTEETAEHSHIFSCVMVSARRV